MKRLRGKLILANFSKKAAEVAYLATYEAELHGPPNTKERPDK